MHASHSKNTNEQTTVRPGESLLSRNPHPSRGGSGKYYLNKWPESLLTAAVGVENTKQCEKAKDGQTDMIHSVFAACGLRPKDKNQGRKGLQGSPGGGRERLEPPCI